MHRARVLGVFFLVVAASLIVAPACRADEPDNGTDSETQSTGESTAAAKDAKKTTATATPEEYRLDEFPKWAWTLRRGETVFFGSLPFSLFVVTFGYEGVRYLVHFNDADANRYTPWPFRSSNAPAYTHAEAIGVGAGIVACSIAVALADYLIGEIRGRRSASR